jgi:lipopolysaccharide/colanic/teichoic acid biosynthesis glycosyltransferase
MHNLHEGGKFNNDFRVSRIGKIMRIFWIDELPMVLNLFSGEIRLVGVRPLSEQYFSLYSKEHQERRIRYKPGLVPPYYADMPKTLEEIEASEKRFLDLYDEHPFSTNWKYFWRAMYNIIIRRARSK